jgi:SNF family Na+-dependent transporter
LPESQVDAGAAKGDEKRDRWTGRWTFILAAVGSAVGLGNFWRFPSLTYKYGGFGNFAVPYLLCLFFMGIPLLLMELGLGQKFQRGDVSVFRSIHKQLAGIGVASVFSSYFITFYYTVIIAWSCVYVVYAFQNPLPWDPSKKSKPFPGATDPAAKKVMFTDARSSEDVCLTKLGYTAKTINSISADALAASRAREFFYIEVVRYFGKTTCEKYNDEKDVTQFSIYSFCACIFVWATIYLAIFNGVHGSSYIVWLTVPIPLVFIVVMMVRGLLLPGAFNGI